MGVVLAAGRPRPRAACVGLQQVEVIESLKNFFPTWWEAERFDLLPEKVDYRELDLLIIGPDAAISPPNISSGRHYDVYQQFTNSAPVISFSSSGLDLPGPLQEIVLRTTGVATTEERALPQGLPLEFDRQRSADLAQAGTSRGWNEYSVEKGTGKASGLDEALRILEEGALVLNPYTKNVFAAFYTRQHTNMGVAVFPPVFDKLAWILLMVQHSAQDDQERFPGFSDWRQQIEWMVPEEAELVKAIAEVEREKATVISELDQRIMALNQELDALTLSVNQGRRRLLTHQGDELVDEVASVFEGLGFLVEDMDSNLPDKAPKREDLRLGISDNDRWHALVEVRGYRASAGRTADLNRLNRFSSMYLQETGRMPDQLIYVVNGQIDIHDPSQREEPLAAAPEDVQVFSESTGLVISTRELFKLANMIEAADIAKIRNSIMQARGRWTD